MILDSVIISLRYHLLLLLLLKDIFWSLANTWSLLLQFSDNEIALWFRCHLLSLLDLLLLDKAELWQLLWWNKSFQVFNHSVYWHYLIAHFLFVFIWLFDSSWSCICCFILSMMMYTGRFWSVYEWNCCFLFASPMDYLWYWYNYSSSGSAWACT